MQKIDGIGTSLLGLGLLRSGHSIIALQGSSSTPQRKRSRVEFPSYQKTTSPFFFGFHFIYIKKADMSGLDAFPCMGPFLPLGTKFIKSKKLKGFARSIHY